MSNINDKIRQIAKETEPELIRIRRELHQYPELGIDLPKTHEIISRELHKIPGLKIREHAAGGYGLIAELQGKKENGKNQSQKLFLTWLIEEPSMYDKTKDYINEDDFVEPLYHHVAALVFEELRATGQVMPARILNQFEDVEEQKTAASLFNTRLKTDDDPAVREKALNETVKRIKKNSLELKSRSVREIADLQKIIKEKAQLQKLYISL